MMNNNKPWINENGIDFVEVNNIVNPPDKTNAGKVVGIDENWRCKLIDVESGDGLPEVTDADDGKVLAVESGKWAAIPASDVKKVYPAITFHYKNGQIIKIGDAQTATTMSGDDEEEITMRELLSSGLENIVYIRLREYDSNDRFLSESEGSPSWLYPPKKYSANETPSNLTFSLMKCVRSSGETIMRVYFTHTQFIPATMTISVMENVLTVN